MPPTADDAFTLLKRAAALAVLLSCASAPTIEPAPPRRTARPPELPPPEIPLVPFDQCSDTGDGFEEWTQAFREHAVAQGISRDIAARVLDDVHYDPSVLELDRTQRAHRVPFEAFVASHVTAARVKRGRQLLAHHAALLERIEARFGVAPEILVALWGLETEFGTHQGNTRSLDALATLAYDCRRAERFRDELASALRILQRGDLSPGEMVGAWAGEIGQTQFLPSSYERFGIDFDGDGHIDLIGSTGDALGSTASYLAGNGCRAHQGYGPGTPNLAVLEAWNRSEVYRKTIVVFAAKLSAKK